MPAWRWPGAPLAPLPFQPGHFGLQQEASALDRSWFGCSGAHALRLAGILRPFLASEGPHLESCSNWPAPDRFSLFRTPQWLSGSVILPALDGLPPTPNPLVLQRSPGPDQCPQLFSVGLARSEIA